MQAVSGVFAGSGSSAIMWLIILVILVVVELATMGLTTIWFAGGSLVAFLAAVLHAGLPVQVVLFFGVSFVLLFFTRPIALKHFNVDRIKTNAESLIGENAIVLEEINNIQGCGRVQVKGQEWAARSTEDSKTVAAGQLVKIQRIEGVKLIVEEATEGETSVR